MVARFLSLMTVAAAAAVVVGAVPSQPVFGVLFPPYFNK